MSYKKLIIIIITVMFALLLGIASLIVMYKYKPELIGLPPNPQDSIKLAETQKMKALSDSLKLASNPPVSVSLSEFNRMQSQLIKNAILRYQNEDIMRQKNYLYDSLNKVAVTMKPAKDSLAMLRDSFQIHQNYIKYLNDSLSKLSTLYNTAIQTKEKDNKAKEKAKADDKAKAAAKAVADSIHTKNLLEYAKIYNGSNPKEVAKIIDQLNEKDAAFIIKNMNKKKAAKVMESLMPETAAAIMLLGVEKPH